MGLLHKKVSSMLTIIIRRQQKIHTTCPHSFQKRFTVNVWPGIMNDFFISSYLLPKRLNNSRFIVFFWKRFYQNCCKVFRLSFVTKCSFIMMMCQPISKWLSTITCRSVLRGNGLAVVDQSYSHSDHQIYRTLVIYYGTSEDHY